MAAVWHHSKQVLHTTPQLYKASRERQLPRYATGGTMGSTVTAPLAAFVTAAVFVGEVTRPQDVPKHQSVPKRSDMLYIHCSYYS